MTQEFLIRLSTFPFTLTYLTSTIPVYLEVYCVGMFPPLIFLTASASVAAFGTCVYIASAQCQQADIVLWVAWPTGVKKSLDINHRRHAPPMLKFPA